ncbi:MULTISPECIES: FecR domain-containing protein [Sphingobium]|jgi:transmembrane sensor|uniref:FecR domain-containing protein n=2 Tax=Sphingobium fuliginis (strain ATCC 27551) TaxID=336203 RepID=A0A292ZHX7_SPHSA|nr:MULTISPECIES: FecR domain-containing protein [Sphingobium]QOT71776.1 FecR domain-containing protein [Sphingobium fuliginis]GAY22536.1 probable transmembrane sensor [Sphingobium fuliginis]
MTETILDQAIAWHRAQDDADFDWDGFTLWLEADPAHRTAFDSIALVDARIVEHRATLAALVPPVDMPGPAIAAEAPRRRRRWVGGGVAAALALAVAIPALRSPAPQPADYRTGPGQGRTILLKDGSRIALAASSHLRVEGAAQDRLALEGSALFDIPHRPGRTMTIEAGGQRISDIGTRFDILADARTMRVAVAEGRISIAPRDGGDAIPLPAGRQLLVDRVTHRGATSAVSPGTVGSWRQGRLVYEAVPLSLVASDLSRYAGVPVRVGADVADRPFSGVLIVGDGSGLVGEVAQFMDLRTVHQGGAVLLRAGAR